MRWIRELSSVLSQYQSEKDTDWLPSETKLQNLYQLISSGKVKSDQEASWEIYRHPKKGKAYLMLKQNLTRRIIQKILALDLSLSPPVFTPPILKNERRLYFVRILLAHNVYHYAEKLLKKAESTALMHQNLEQRYRIVQLFCTLYTMKGEEKQWVKRQEELILIEADLKKENRYRAQFQEIAAHTKYSSALYPAYGIEIQLKLIHYKSESWKAYLTLISAYHQGFPAQVVQEYEDHKKTIRDLQNRLPYPDFMAQELVGRSLLQLQEVEKLNRWIALMKKYHSYPFFHRYALSAIEFQLYLKQEDWQAAQIISNDVKRSERYEMLHAIDKAAWWLRDAYLQLIRYFEEKIPLSPFLLQECQEVKSVLAKDKGGYLMQLHFLETVILFLKDEEADGYSLAEKLRVYRYRHLKNWPEKRTAAFWSFMIKLLQNKDSPYKPTKITLKFTSTLEALGDYHDAHEWISYTKWQEYLLKTFCESPVMLS